MHETHLARLRSLRAKAQALLDDLASDLLPFVKGDGTFRRTPSSSSNDDDVNVTTTCSCWMALAAANKFKDFYANGFSLKHPSAGSLDPDMLMRTIFDAPWMSSGLSANNAFTTALVFRAFGHLTEHRILTNHAPNCTFKQWEVNAGLYDVAVCASTLSEHKDEASQYIWLSLSEKTQNLINVGGAIEGRYEEQLRIALSADLRSIIQSGWIYDKDVFDKASDATRNAFEQKPVGYKRSQWNQQLLADQFPAFIEPPKRVSLSDMAAVMASDPANFSINK